MSVAVHQGMPRELRLPNFLLSYRSTLHATTNHSPSSLFLQLRTRLDLLRPSCADHVTQKHAKQSLHHDSHARTREFSDGQEVWARNFKHGLKWTPGVVQKHNGLLSYSIRVVSGVIWNRHVDHLRQRQALVDIPENPESDSDAFVDLPSISSQPENEHVAEHVPATVCNPPAPQADLPGTCEPAHSRYPTCNHRPPTRYRPSI